MKNILLFLLGALMMCQTCREKEHSLSCSLLLTVDSLMQSHPDSALSILERIGHPQKMSSADRAYYALLLTQAYDKNYIDQESDSLILTAVGFYDSVQIPSLQMRSHYYLARIYQDMDSVSASVLHFLKAAQMAEDLGNADFMSLSCNNLGCLLEANELLEEAYLFYRKAEEAAVLGRDSSRLALFLKKQGDISIQLGEKHFPKAEEKLLKAYDMNRKYGNAYIEMLISNSLTALYSNMQLYPKVIEWGNKCINIPVEKDSAGLYLALGDAFYYLHRNDSAVYYLMKSLISSNPFTRQGSYELLSRIASGAGDYAETNRWRDSCLHYTNLIASIPKPIEAVKKLKDVLNQQSMEQYQTKVKWRWCIAGGIGLLLVMLTVYFICKQKKVQVYLHESKADLKSINELLETKNSEMQHLQELMGEYENDRGENSLLRKELKNMKLEMEKLVEQAVFLLPVYRKMKELIKVNKEKTAPQEISADFQQEVIASLNNITGNFADRLAEDYPQLKKDDLFFCCLVKMGFKYSEIAGLLGRTPNMMYKRRDAVIQRMEINLSSSFEAFIRDL